MLSYLQFLQPEPNPLHFSGKCKVCKTEHFNGGPDEGFETSPCACGIACCECCDKCSDCGERVCPDCSVDISNRSTRQLICAPCHLARLNDYLDVPYIHEPNQLAEVSL